MPKHQLVNIIDIIFLSILLLEISACNITDDEFVVKPGSIREYFFESSLKKFIPQINIKTMILWMLKFIGM